MSIFYYDDGIKGLVPLAEWKQVQTADDSNSYKNGDIVEAWDHVFRWDSDCISNSKMAAWRFRGDQLADVALPILQGPAGDAGGTDLIARLEASATSANSPIEAAALWRHVCSIDESEFRYDKQQIARGQAVFYRYAPHILTSLLQFSLAAGFSSPRICRVLNLGSYLVPPMSSTPKGEAPRITRASNDRTYQRLMETTQFVIDCMAEGALEVGGPGWKAAVRVRLLHATMRVRILDRVRREFKDAEHPPYNEERDGIPISQEDYAATLASFAAAPLISLIKVGITPSAQECEDYIALWKVIGYYLGISEDILAQHMSSWHQSSRLLACSVVSVLASESDPPPPAHFPFEKALVPKQDRVRRVKHISTNPDPWTSPATLPVLFSVCNRWPSPFSMLDHSAASRRLCGPSLSDWLSIPKTSWFTWFKLQLGFGLVNIPPKFAQIYRTGWDRRRRMAMQRSVEGAIISQLGDRVTKFRPRAPGAFEPAKEADEFGVSPTGKYIQAAWEWTLVYGEMVILAPILLPIYICQTTWRMMVEYKDIIAAY